MSSRAAEKQRRRAEREARQRDHAARERRERRLRLAATAAVGVVLVAAISALPQLGGGGEVPLGSEGTFGQHYEGLERRRIDAGVSTMSAPSDASVHVHPKLAVWLDGRRIAVPSNIGIDPRAEPGEMAGLHTHSGDGTIHVEGMAGATLGQFFRVWGVPFGKDRLGPYRAGGGKVVQVWVDGNSSQDWASLRLANGQDIRVRFGPRAEAPPPG
jgi:hypothetical protein